MRGLFPLFMLFMQIYAICGICRLVYVQVAYSVSLGLPPLPPPSPSVHEQCLRGFFSLVCVSRGFVRLIRLLHSTLLCCCQSRVPLVETWVNWSSRGHDTCLHLLDVNKMEGREQ